MSSTTTDLEIRRLLGGPGLTRRGPKSRALPLAEGDSKEIREQRKEPVHCLWLWRATCEDTQVASTA